jgi:hypothetical protein
MRWNNWSILLSEHSAVNGTIIRARFKLLTYIFILFKHSNNLILVTNKVNRVINSLSESVGVVPYCSTAILLFETSLIIQSYLIETSLILKSNISIIIIIIIISFGILNSVVNTPNNYCRFPISQ